MNLSGKVYHSEDQKLKTVPLSQRDHNESKSYEKEASWQKIWFWKDVAVLNIPSEYGRQKGRNITDFPWWCPLVFLQWVCWLGSHRCAHAFLEDQCLANRKVQKRQMGLWKGVGIESADCRCRIISKHKYLTYHFLAVSLQSPMFYK